MRKATILFERQKSTIAALTLVAGIGLLGASPAEAKGDFAYGFEDQLGRLAAVEVFQVGHAVLSASLLGHVAAFPAPWRAPRRGFGYSHHDRYDRHPVAHRPRRRGYAPLHLRRHARPCRPAAFDFAHRDHYDGYGHSDRHGKRRH